MLKGFLAWECVFGSLIAAVLICANDKNRYGKSAGSQVFLNIDCMLLQETGKRQEYPVFLTESSEDTVEFFIGRNKEMEKLRESIIAKDSSLLLSGVGGLGKTELVKRFVRAIMNTEIDERVSVCCMDSVFTSEAGTVL